MLLSLAGEISTHANIDVETIVRNTVNKIGYNHSDLGFDGSTCAVINMIGKQSPEIAQGVDRQRPEDQGAGDQGLMFGYATNETDVLMPAPPAEPSTDGASSSVTQRWHLPWLRPDAKAQVTLRYDEHHQPLAVDALVLSTQHNPDISQNSSKKPSWKKSLKSHSISAITQRHTISHQSNR